MELKQFIFRIKNINKDKNSQKVRESCVSKNPFTKGAEGRTEWDDRYMNMRSVIKNWRIAFFSAMDQSVYVSTYFPLLGLFLEYPLTKMGSSLKYKKMQL